MIIKTKSLAEAMMEGFIALNDAPIRSPRGKRTKELMNVQIEVEYPRSRIAKIPGRNYNLAFNLAEFLTYVSGINSVDYISQFNDNIAKFSDNGVVFYGSYGERLRNNIPKLIKKLRDNPDTRQGVMTIFHSRDAYENTKDTPCTVALDFKLRDNKLNLHTFMRSNDIIWGFQYDMFNFTLLQEIIANSLGVELGSYYHTATSFHIYERHWDFLSDTRTNMEFEPISMRVDYDYEDILEIAKKSYKYAHGDFNVYNPDDPILTILNYYNYKKQISDNKKMIKDIEWARKLYGVDK